MKPLVVERPAGRRGRLLAVPAVHCRHAFAAEVRRLCVREATRPDAIAVELPPDALGATASWIRELRLSDASARRLPCLLGLLRISPGSLDPCAQVAIPNLSEPGSDDLGKARTVLLPLSPSDSIIEAVQCAIELGIPLYGIDADAPPHAERTSIDIEDPSAAGADVAGYVARNADYADSHYDASSDGPREIAMAAGLGALLRKYDRVLVTGGLAHWQRLTALLEDTAGDERLPDEAFATTPDASAPFQRVLVHPLCAIRFLDAFPRVTAAYQNWRGCTRRALPDPARTFERALARTYRRYFRRRPHAIASDRRDEDLGARRQWEQFLGNLCTLRRQVAPTLATALEAATATMSPAFAEALLESLLSFRWATPRDFPGLPVFGEPARDGDGAGSSGAMLWRPPGSVATSPLRVRVNWPASKARARSTRCKDNRDGGTMRRQAITMRSWPPSDRVAAALCHRAAVIAEGEGIESVSAPFAGSWNGRIDVRATARAFVRGERSIHLREPRRARGGESGERLDWEPTVFLFPPNGSQKPSYELFFPAMVEAVEAADDAERGLLDRHQPMAQQMVVSTSYGNRVALPGSDLDEMTLRLRMLRGVTFFMPPHLTTAVEEARWLDRMGPGTLPMLADFSISGLIKMLDSRHGIALDIRDWKNALVRMALPYARRRVVVVAAGDYRPAPVACAEAARLGVEISIVAAPSLPQPLLERVSRYVMARPWRDDSSSYPSEIETTLGEQAAALSEFVPPPWRNLGTLPVRRGAGR